MRCKVLVYVGLLTLVKHGEYCGVIHTGCAVVAFVSSPNDLVHSRPGEIGSTGFEPSHMWRTLKACNRDICIVYIHIQRKSLIFLDQDFLRSLL